MITTIPTQAVPNQQIIITLNGQQCVINLYIRNYIDYGVPVGIEPLYVYNSLGYLDTLSINPDDPSDLLLINSPVTGLKTNWQNMYMDLYVSGQTIFLGQPVVFGSYINQFHNPNFKGYLYIYTEDGLDPVYQNLGTTTTLNYTDGVLSN